MTHPAARWAALLLAILPAGTVVNGVGLLAAERPIPGVSALVVGGAFLAALASFVASPARAEATLARPLGARLDRGSAVVGYFLQVAIVYVFIGFLSILQGAFLVEALLETGTHPASDQPFEESLVLQSQLLVFTLLVLGAVSWPLLVEDKGGARLAGALGLAPVRSVPTAVAVFVGALAYLALLLAIAAAFKAFGWAEPVNPQAEALKDALSPTGMMLLALMAGIGEELYFRGFLQTKIGNLRQAVLFGVVHVSYLTPLQVLLPFAIGYLFGLMRGRVGLWAPILLHAGFDAVAFFAPA